MGICINYIYGLFVFIENMNFADTWNVQNNKNSM